MFRFDLKWQKGQRSTEQQLKGIPDFDGLDRFIYEFHPISSNDS